MQFKHSQEIDAPVEYVFKRATDFKAFEHYTGTKGFSFVRRKPQPIRIGTQWNITFPFRGRSRKFRAELSELIPPRTVSYTSVSKKYTAALSLTFTPISANKSRMDMLMVAQSRSFGTSLVFNSIRLARRRINRRITKGMQGLADRLALEYARDAE